MNIEKFMEGYKTAWERKDESLFCALFASDGAYHNTPFAVQQGGIEPSVVTHHGLTSEDAELIVVLAACLHDSGISVHRDHHERYSLFIAFRKARELF